MAIKVSGTTVVDDSRGLTNIATVDATTAAAISAAGVGGGGEHDFVASGTISTGDVVALNSDGTVSVAVASTTSTGTPVTFLSSNSAYISATFDSNSNKVVVAYQDYGGDRYGYAVVGTVSGTSISFGTPTVFVTAYSSNSYSATFDSNSNKVVISYKDYANSGHGMAVVGTVSGTSISFGTPVDFSGSGAGQMSATFDSNSNKVVIAYSDGGNSSYGTAVVGTVSGTSISFGTPVVFESAYLASMAATFDSNSNKVVIVYRDYGNSSYGTAIVGTVSGTSISFGTKVVFLTASLGPASVIFDSNSNKVVIAYVDYGNSAYGTAIVGTVSGTSISFGTPAVFRSASMNYISATFDSNSNKVVIAYQDYGNSYSYYGTAVDGTVSGTSISFGTTVTFESANSAYISATFDSNSNKVVVAYRDGGNSSYGTAAVIELIDNVNDYIGVAAEGISDTATGSITILGGVNDQQSGLTIGSTYYVADDGSLITTNNGRKIGRAISATKLLVNS